MPVNTGLDVRGSVERSAYTSFSRPFSEDRAETTKCFVLGENRTEDLSGVGRGDDDPSRQIEIIQTQILQILTQVPHPVIDGRTKFLLSSTLRGYPLRESRAGIWEGIAPASVECPQMTIADHIDCLPAHPARARVGS